MRANNTHARCVSGTVGTIPYTSLYNEKELWESHSSVFIPQY